jgi:serine/threonine protein kinase/Tfp pilus assembly protein PilF
MVTMALTVSQMARMSQLLDEALALDDSGRSAWLERLSQEHADIAQPLRDALLRVPGATTASLLDKEPPADFAAQPLVSGLRPGDRVGPYALVRHLGAGGMAEVWLASRADGAYQREVALKLPMLSRLRRDLARRFELERDILAGLEHVHIGRLYDAGVDEGGLPYLAMEYVRGEPLTSWCDAHQLAIRERVRLFLQVLDAVQYAHGRKVIHRDLKPSNILVTQEGEVRLLDFGVAKLLTQEAGEQTQLTEAYGRALTPDYASPEALLGDAATERSDIYSLGVVLYELLSGARPYRLKAGASALQIEKAITESEIPRPSARVSADAATLRSASVEQLARRLRGDLDVIVLKSLARVPAERYDSVAVMADDLRRYLAGEPVLARPHRLPYRLVKLLLKHRAGVALSAMAALCVAAVLVLVRDPRTPPSPAQPVVAAPPDRSIAVLPFVDLSERKDQEYFSDGIAEELIDLLSRIPEVQVAARTSAFSFKGKEQDARAIAARLGVANLIEGSVRKAGNVVRITVQLVRADTGYHLWSQTYDRRIDDVFRVQDEIAAAVVASLKVSLLQTEMPHVIGTRSPEAHLLYLQAEYLYSRVSSRADFEKINDYLQQAIKLDPSYAAAWAFLSSMRSALAANRFVPVPQGWEDARAAATRALTLQPDLASAHTAMAKIQIINDWDWAGAQVHIDRALALESGNASVLVWAGILSETRGHLDRAISLFRRATIVNPLDANVALHLGRIYYRAGDQDKARESVDRALELNAQVPGAHLIRAQSLLASGQVQAAFDESEREKDEDRRLMGKALVYHALGKTPEADATLAELEQRFGADAPFEIAEIHAFRGEVDQAFAWLDRALTTRAEGCVMAKVDPLLLNIAKDPRFVTVLRTVRLAD